MARSAESESPLTVRFSSDVSGTGRAVTWPSFDMPVLIQDTVSGDQTIFVYGPDRARMQQQSTRAGRATTIIYVGTHYEEKVVAGGNTDKVHYIRAGSTVAIYTIDDTGVRSPIKASVIVRRYIHIFILRWSLYSEQRF